MCPVRDQCWTKAESFHDWTSHVSTHAHFWCPRPGIPACSLLACLLRGTRLTARQPGTFDDG